MPSYIPISRWRFALALRENGRVALHPPPPLLWLGLGCLALVASNDLPNHFDLPRVTDPLVATLVFVALLLAFAAFARAIWTASNLSWSAPISMLRMPSGWTWATVARWLWYPVLLWLALAAAQSVGGVARTLATHSAHWPPLYTSDDLYDNQYNALLALRGEKPLCWRPSRRLAHLLPHQRLHSRSARALQ